MRPALLAREALGLVEAPRHGRQVLHLLDPDAPIQRRTLCGQPCVRWRRAGEVSTRRIDLFLRYRLACGHCARAIQREVAAAEADFGTMRPAVLAEAERLGLEGPTTLFDRVAAGRSRPDLPMPHQPGFWPRLEEERAKAERAAA